MNTANGTRKDKILIVDDTPANIHVLMGVLQDSFAIQAATHGEKALSLARSANPDLILLDVVMEGMDGYTVYRRLKDDVRTAHIPVIFVTALSEQSDEAQGLALGAVDYITKPFHADIVRARVRNHLELKRYRDRLEVMVEEQVAEIASSQQATIFALSKLAESRDDDTGQHLERTQHYCFLLADYLLRQRIYADSVDEEFVQLIRHASPLHDIGKVAIPDTILRKPGKLTPEEFDIMKTHTVRGAETLAVVAQNYPRNGFVNLGMEIARWHHEKWNGEGYPDRLRGPEIPICARIMAVADVYDALTSQRCYKPAFPHEKSRDIILEESGRHFDPVVVEAFMALQLDFQEVRRRYNQSLEGAE